MKSPIRKIDQAGRLALPVHIRKALNIAPDSLVEVELSDDGEAALIRATKERCSVCGKPVDEKPHAEIDANGTKLVCYECAQAIAQDMIRRM